MLINAYISSCQNIAFSFMIYSALAEQMRNNDRALRKAGRDVERDRRELEREEKKLEGELLPLILIIFSLFDFLHFLFIASSFCLFSFGMAISCAKYWLVCIF